MVRVMSEISPVDPVEKDKLKLAYIEEDIKTFEGLLGAYYMQGLISGTIPDNGKPIGKLKDINSEMIETSRRELELVHPHCKQLLEAKEKTADKVRKYASGNTFRPESPAYLALVKDLKHFQNSIFSPSVIREIYGKLCTIFNLYSHNAKNNLQREPEVIHKETQANIHPVTSWVHSVQSFYKNVDKKYSEEFPDLVKPLLSSISQCLQSVIDMKSMVCETLARMPCAMRSDALKSVALELVEYPNSVKSENQIHKFCRVEFREILERYVGSRKTLEIEYLETAKFSLREVQMYASCYEQLSPAVFKAATLLLHEHVVAWDLQQRDMEKQKQDEDNLYVTKSKCEDIDEESQALEEIKVMFPSYSDTDFVEFKPSTLEEKKSSKKLTQTTPKPTQLLTHNDVTYIYEWHSEFIQNLTVAEWLKSPKKKLTCDYLKPLLLRYPTFSKIVKNSWEAMEADFEGRVTPSLMVLLSELKAEIEGTNSSNQKPDFYLSAWVSEARQCKPVLERVRETTDGLLAQWPDFPTLKDIKIILDRIASFPVTSPIARFLTGVELLRDRIEDWNKNAHSGNNMVEVSQAVGRQIVNWRKLEMAHWKECLNTVFRRKQSEAHKYWFHIYSVVHSYLLPEDATDHQKVGDVLRDFMEKATLAEYETRLNIVYTFHCHLVHERRSHKRDVLLAIFWNTYNYYAQFAGQVSSHIKEKRAPIEKKLRDFVKICSWERDLSYWSVKDTVEKAHKTLHKHMKEFEETLKAPASTCLVINATTDVCSDHVGIWDRPKRATSSQSSPGGSYLVDPLLYVALARNVKKHLDNCENAQDSNTGLLSKIPSLFDKAKRLCKETITQTSYPSLVQSLDDFVTQVIETSQHLGSLEVDTTVPKVKQMSQAKNILQQKRKALADLFRALTRAGLSYRAGLMALNSGSELHDFTTPPVDLTAAVEFLKSKRADTALASLWGGCEMYLQRSVARSRHLAAVLRSPHADVDAQCAERCRGFGAALMKMVYSQKKSISKYSRQLFDLRNLLSNITLLTDCHGQYIKVSTLRQQLELLSECYVSTICTLEQFLIILKSCPEQAPVQEYEPNFDATYSRSPIVKCFKNSEEWNKLHERIDAALKTAIKQKTALIKLNMTLPRVINNGTKMTDIVSQAHVDTAKDAYYYIENIKTDLEALINEYQFKVDEDLKITASHPVLKCIVDTLSHINEVTRKVNSLDEPSEVKLSDGVSAEEFRTQTEDLIATLLLVVQSIYKKHLATKDESADIIEQIDEIIEGKTEKIDENESRELITENHLKQQLVEALNSDIKSLQLENIIEKTQNVLSKYVQSVENGGSNVDELKDILSKVIPIFEQGTLFVQYFVTQQVACHRVSCKMLSVLLKIFSDLATKGFCKPSELDSETGEGEGEGRLSSGTGLGEGEGQKDVSEKIENQDQLEDARRPGDDEKKEEDRDCKEEEKGVNMTDDFDSHLQDIDKKDNDDSEQEEDDEHDKQMGETDNAAEKLDQQIWGSDDDEASEDEQSKNEKEDKGKGDKTGEKELAAREDQRDKEKDDGGTGDDRKKKKKDINEMEEPELDDDHVDPYHGKHQPLPEPEDFELPDDMNLDGDQKQDDEDDNEGETETENPFEIDKIQDQPIEDETKQEEGKEDADQAQNRDKHGQELSSDEEDDKQEENGDKDEDKDLQADEPTQEDDKMEVDETADDEGDEGQAEKQEEQPDDPEKPVQGSETKAPEAPTAEDEQSNEAKLEPTEEARPSNNDPSVEDDVEKAETDKGTEDHVQVNQGQNKDEEAAPYEQAQEQSSEQQQSTGRAEVDQSESGRCGEEERATKATAAPRQNRELPPKKNKPGQTEQERTLGEVTREKQTKSKTLNADHVEDESEGPNPEEQGPKQADLYQHVKQAKDDDVQALDSATKEQADLQPRVQHDDEEGEEVKPDDDIAMDVDNDNVELEKTDNELAPEKTSDRPDPSKPDQQRRGEGGEEGAGETVEVEGEVISTTIIARPADTSYHTRLEDMRGRPMETDLSSSQYMSLREYLHCGRDVTRGQGAAVWRSLWASTGLQARLLSERLRLVLEPTGRSRLAGDYRTGRRINMRRVIPYIASHFRKDRIWLRRTRPAKREYKIAVAVDDSSSMADNRSKELAFESLALVSQALNLLESGDLSVLSFGERPAVLHPFSEQFSEHSGARILERLRFDQTRTRVAQLLDFATVMFEEQGMRSDAANARLLVIVSDGRGIFAEGEARVVQAVRRARQAGIFLVYVLIDNPDNKDSIMDIRKWTSFINPTTNKLEGTLTPYLDSFPFPFYLILRDMTALPAVLGDALRQWFELAANTS